MADKDIIENPPADAGEEEELNEDKLWEEFTAGMKSPADEDAHRVILEEEPEPARTPEEVPPLDEVKPAVDDPPEVKDEEPPAKEIPAKADDKETLEDQITRLTHDLATSQGRERGQQKRAARLSSELGTLKKSIERRDKTDETRKERTEKLAGVAEEYTDLAPVVEAVGEQQQELDERNQQDKDRVSEIEGEISGIHDDEVALLEAEHPDWLTLVSENQKVFDEWIEDQPRKFDNIWSENKAGIVDGKASALLLSRFKSALEAAEVNEPDPVEDQKSQRQEHRERQLAGARSAQTPGRRATVSDEPGPDATEDEIWEHSVRLAAANK